MRKAKQAKIKDYSETRPGDRVAAKVVLRDAENMSARGAQSIARWLEREARRLRKTSWRKRLAKRFTSSYHYSSTRVPRTR